jgi:hypothetical protein
LRSVPNAASMCTCGSAACAKGQGQFAALAGRRAAWRRCCTHAGRTRAGVRMSSRRCAPWPALGGPPRSCATCVVQACRRLRCLGAGRVVALPRRPPARRRRPCCRSRSPLWRQRAHALRL